MSRFFLLVGTLLGSAVQLFAQLPAFHFLTRTDFQVNHAFNLMAGDFNHDGIAELALSNPDGVTVFLGDANHGFHTVFTSIPNGGAGLMAVADINNDGKLDLVAFNGGTTFILWGNGDGTFTVGPAVGIVGNVAAVGDFNGDGKIDLALTGGYGVNQVNVLLGNGDGTFKQSATLPLPTSWCVSVGDFNGDGKADIAGCGYSNTSEVDVFLGHGDGTFSSAITSTIPSIAVYLAVGDLNGDGKADLVGPAIYQNGVNPNLGPVYVLYGNGDGTFKPTLQVHSQVGGLASLAIGDLDGDGRLDIVAIGVYGEAAVLHNNGHGGFTRQAVYPLTLNVVASDQMALVKLAKDPLPSVVSSNDGGYFFSILMNNGKGRFADVKSINMPGVFSAVIGAGFGGLLEGMAEADFNGDGKPDLAVPLAQGHPWNKEFVRVLFGTGKANAPFRAGPDTPTPASAEINSLVAGDFNGDGKADLAIAFYTNPPVIQVLLGDGAGGFSPGPSFMAPGGLTAFNMTAKDLNGDGKLDLALSSGYVLLGNGDGSFGQPLQFYNGTSNGNPGLWVDAADFNQDGKLDLAYLDDYSPEQLRIFLGNGDGTFQQPTAYPLLGVHEWAQIADFNGDGIPDVAVLFLGAGDSQHQVAVYLGLGDGTLAPPAYLPGPPTEQPIFLLAGDFNGDANIDLVVMDEYAGLVFLYAGNGDGSFAAPVEFGFGEFPGWMVAGNYHGEKRPGFPDLAGLTFGGSSVSVLLNQGR